jgi:uncharacterized protein
MPEYLAPGVFIEEIERGPRPIEGVATSTAAFLGETERGPVKPTFITNYGEYLRTFGGIFDPGAYMPYAVKAFFDNGGGRCYVVRVVGDNTPTATADFGPYTATAVGPGPGYNRVWLRIDQSSTKDGQGEPIGFRLRVYYWDKPAENVPYDPIDESTLPDPRPPEPSTVEDFDDLSVDPSSPNYYQKMINNGNSSFIELTADADAGLPGEQSVRLGPVAAGDKVTSASYRGSTHPDRPTGLAALDLDPYRSVAIVHAPGAHEVDEAIAGLVINHCERNRFRFAVVDAPAGEAQATSLDPRTDIRPSSYAAFYYPWLWVSDPQSGARKKIPPGGAVCGIYALTDNSRGVWKAPANEVVAGAIDLEYDIDTRTQEDLNPKGVNVIRRFPGRGIRVWGARTLAADPLWKYVNVRRLFIFLEASIYNSTQWVVFEPNDQRLWARVKQTVTLFLRTQWREGALFGAKEEEAFTVAVGRETMTEDDILNGRLIIEVGIAPVRPAEFVIFRIFQKTQEAKS